MTGRWRRASRISLLLAVTAAGLGFGVAGLLLAGAARGRVALAALVWLAALLVLVGAAVVAGRLARRLPPRTVVELDLTTRFVDHAGRDPAARLAARGRPSLREVVETLERAAADPRVAGLYARLGVTGASLAELQELRDAVATFASSGKPSLVHADSFGEFSDATGAYFLATAFDRVHLQPSGEVGTTGLAEEVTFFGTGLKRLGVDLEIDRRKEYKTAANRFTETAFTPEHREASERLVTSLFDQLIAGIAAGRGLDQSRVRQLVDRAPLPAVDALDAGLVDRLAYRDESAEAAREQAGEGAKLLPLGEYRRRVVRARRRRGATSIALIHGSGSIVQGRSRIHPLTGRAMGADSIVDAFQAAMDDGAIKAILFRVDSPGGSYVGSDAIWRAVARARESGKPVVVSMGTVAASGGYFVAAAADRIVAHPTTITGSIGVIAGKQVVANFKAKLGLSTDAVQRGRNALLSSSARSFTGDQWTYLRRQLDRIYDDFTHKVATGRGLELGEVLKAAQGRVWSGADAHQRGLVDVLGGYPAALRAVREVAGLDADTPLALKVFPTPGSVLSRMRERADTGDGLRSWAALALEPGGPAGRFGLPAASGALTMQWPVQPWSRQ